MGFVGMIHPKEGETLQLAKHYFMQMGFPLSNWQKVQLNTDLLKQRRT